MRRALIPLVPLALLASGCTYPVDVDPSGAAGVVTRVVARSTQQQAIDVRCPAGVMATVGATFFCTYYADGLPYRARVRVTGVKGDVISFYVSTRQTS